MPTQYLTERQTLNVAPTTLFQATDTTSFIIARVLLKNERNEGVKVTIKLNGFPIVSDLAVPIFSQKPIELDTIAKLRLIGTDTLEILVLPNSSSGAASFGQIGGFPWYTTVDANVATIILSYVKQTP